MDLNKAQKKIRNAWIAGLVPGVCYLSFIIWSSIMIGSPGILIMTIPVITISFGLPFGVYKSSRFSAIAMFMLIICVVAYLFDFTSEISEDIFGVYIGIGCVSFALLYFTFEGIRGTFTYHELIKTNQNNNKNIGAYSTLIPDIISIIVIIAVGVISLVALSKQPDRSPSTAAARGVGSVLSSTIKNKHADYLINGTEYTTSDVLADTQYFGGITATTGSPADGQIGYSGNVIRLNYKNKIYEWDYIPRNGDTPAHITENVDSDF